MKKLILIACIFCALNSNAQNGFFLQPEFGAGIGNTTAKFQSNIWVIRTDQPKPVTAYDFRLGAGFNFGHWAIASGIGYERSGFKRHYIDGDFVTIDNNLTEYFYHIMVPVTLSYRIRLCDHFYIAPAAGACVSYNTYVDETIVSKPGGTSVYKYTGTMFENNFNRFSLWGIVKAELGYKLNRQLTVTAGPEMQYMVTSANKNPNQNNYTVMLNAGVKWFLKAKTTMPSKASVL